MCQVGSRRTMRRWYSSKRSKRLQETCARHLLASFEATRSEQGPSHTSENDWRQRLAALVDPGPNYISPAVEIADEEAETPASSRRVGVARSCLLRVTVRDAFHRLLDMTRLPLRYRLHPDPVAEPTFFPGACPVLIVSFGFLSLWRSLTQILPALLAQAA